MTPCIGIGVGEFCVACIAGKRNSFYGASGAGAGTKGLAMDREEVMLACLLRVLSFYFSCCLVSVSKSSVLLVNAMHSSRLEIAAA